LRDELDIIKARGISIPVDPKTAANINNKEMQNKLNAAIEEIEKLKNENDFITKSLNQTLEDQKLLAEQKKLSDLEHSAKIEKYALDIKMLNNKHAEEIIEKDKKIGEMQKKLEIHAEEMRTLQTFKAQEENKTMRAQLEAERSENRAHELEVDIATKYIKIKYKNQ